MKRIILAISLLTLGSCGKNVVTSTPGAVNTFDANTYNSLITAQASIEQAKTIVTPTTPQSLKDTLNKIIASYNLVENAYKTYHTNLVAGKNPDSTVLSTQITQLVSDLAKLITTLKGGK